MEEIKEAEIKEKPAKKRGPYKPRKVLVVNKTRDAHIEVNLLMPGKSGQSYRIEIPNISGVTTGTMRNPDNFIGIITDAIKSRFPKAVIK